MGMISKFVHTIHGIHTSEGKKSTPATLVPLLEQAGHACYPHDYGYVFAITARFINQGIAKKYAPLIADGDIIIAHSNGCDIVRRMLKKGIKPEGIILLQPALDKDTEFPAGDYWIKVFHNDDDKIVWWSKWLPFRHPYGEMGKVGYVGNDPRVSNFDTLKLCSAGGHYEHIRENQCVRQAIVGAV